MKEREIFKILTSIPVILIVLYFIPFLGVCLIIFRYFIYKNKYYKLPLTLVICGILIIIPNIVNSILKSFKINSLENLITLDIYQKLVPYSKRLITVGIIFLIISYIVKIIYNKVSNKLTNEFKNYIQKEEQRSAEISAKNDLIMKEKREKAQNTHVVYCPYCGSDNMITGSVGTCKYCRRKIEYKGEK